MTKNKGSKPIESKLPANLVDRLEKIKAIQQEQFNKKIEKNARPGESWQQACNRILAEKQKKENTLGTAPKNNISNHSSLRKPPMNERQKNFFIPGLYDITKDNLSLMDVAVFRLSKKIKRAGDIIRYDLSDGYVEVKAGPDGMATVWDYDIVLMLISHLTEAMNRYKAGRGEMPGRLFMPHVSDIMKFCRRGDGGKQVNLIESTLDRLKGTIIKSIRERKAKNGNRTVREVESEGLISAYKVVSYTDNGKVASVEIEAANWIYREITESKQPDVLTVHPDYFLITPGLGRFLYRLARRAAGKESAKWSFKTIYERSGSSGSFKEFTRLLRNLIKSNDLPEYNLQEEKGQMGPLLIIEYKNSSIEE